MGSYHRRLARLPSDIFNDLVFQQQQDPVALRQEICAKFSNRNVQSVGDLFAMCTEQIVEVLDPLLSYHECQELEARILQRCRSSSNSALSLLQESCFLSTGLAQLDECLHGGIPVGNLTEVVGRAGVGKSQFAMQLCVLTALRNYQCIYIDTEKKLSLSRLREIASHTSETAATRVLERIIVHSPSGIGELVRIVRQLDEHALALQEKDAQKRPVKLLVLDSIAAPFIRTTTSVERVETLLTIAQTLKRVASQLDLAILIVNQLGDYKENTSRAALGMSWHHCLSTRILMEHESDPHQLSNQDMQQSDVRKATLVKSNVAANATMQFKITNMGIVQIDLHDTNVRLDKSIECVEK